MLQGLTALLFLAASVKIWTGAAIFVPRPLVEKIKTTVFHFTAKT